MSTIEDKLRYLINTKDIIKQSIIDKGVSVNDNDTFRSYANKISSIQTGSAVTKGEFVCRAIDYDGTILKEQHLNTGDTFTLPSLPTHDGLVAQGWSTPVDIVNNQVTVSNSDLIFGVTYTTASGLSEFDIELTKATGLNVTLNMDGTKDWGDGVTNTETTHTYANYGKYTITCDGSTITSSSSSGIFGQTSTDKNYNYYCTSVRIYSSVTSISSYAFNYCYSLKDITMPNSVTSIGTYAFQYCNSLTNIIIPNSVTSIGMNAFTNSYSLTNIIIPNGVTSIGSFGFSGCHSFKDITIPNSVTKISGGVFSGCTLTHITIPNGVTRIDSLGLSNCISITEYDFSKCTAVPTLGATSAFTGINKLCKIIVPDNLYNEWIAATNWSTYADYIYKESEVL